MCESQFNVLWGSAMHESFLILYLYDNVVP
jgi:hypothetical protein